MAIQRFMYLNDLSGENFLRLLYWRGEPGRTPTHRALIRTYRNSSHVQNGTLPLKFLETLDQVPRPVPYGPGRSCFQDERPVRYCVECLTHCYHSYLFQFPAVSCCPYHGTELHETCPHCGQPVSRLGFVPASHPCAFCCTNCSRPYVSDAKAAQRVLLGLPEACDSLDAAYEHVARVVSAQVISTAGMARHDFLEDRSFRFHCHALHAAATQGASRPSWLSGLDDNVTYRVAGPMVDVRHGTELAEDAPQTLAEYLQPFLSTLKTIDRQLSREVLSVCRHSSPRRLLSFIDKPGWEGIDHFLALQPLDCPCCAVLAWWRAHWGYYFAWQQFAAKWPRPLAWRNELARGLGHAPSRTDELAVAAWDSFMSLSIRMHYRFAARTQQMLPLHRRLIADIADHKSPAYRALLIRNGELTPHFYGLHYLELEQLERGAGAVECTDAQGAPCFIAYSRKNAMRALADLHFMRTKGPLWAAPCSDLPPKCGNARDVWYRESWTLKMRKTWTGDFQMMSSPTALRMAAAAPA